MPRLQNRLKTPVTVTLLALLTACGATARDGMDGLSGGIPASGGSDQGGDGTDTGEPVPEDDDNGKEGSTGSEEDPMGSTGSEPSTSTSTSTTTGDDQPSSGDGEVYTGEFAMERELCMNMNNMFREMSGRQKLERYAEKEECVDNQAMEESLIDTPHGKLGMCGEARQNHGDGFFGPNHLQLIEIVLNDQFNEGPGGPHYEQILDPNMTRMACGFYKNANGNFWMNIDLW